MENTNMSNKTMTEQLAAIETATVAVEPAKSILELLSDEQKNSLEAKFNKLPTEFKTDVRNLFPSVKTPVELYVLRQMVKEATAFQASKYMPIWIDRLALFVAALVSTDQDSRKEAERIFRNLADEIPEEKHI